MLKIIFWVFKAFFSMIGSIMFGIILIVLFGPELGAILNCFMLGFLSFALLFAGIFFDRKLRRKFNLSHKQMFSPLWTTISIIELSVFTVFMIITILALIPISVLICNLIIYMVLSVLILSNKIKKITNSID